jgi:hypothetical protein
MRRSHGLAYSMAAPQNAAVSPGFGHFQQLVLEGLGRPLNRKRLVDDFPRFVVRCFLKDRQIEKSVQPFQDQTFRHRFPVLQSWDLIEKIHENNCRYVRLLSYLFIVRIACSIHLVLPLKFQQFFSSTYRPVAKCCH